MSGTHYVGDGKGGVREVLDRPILVGDGKGGLRLTIEPNEEARKAEGQEGSGAERSGSDG